MSATLIVKPTGIPSASQFSITINLEATVAEAKDQIAKHLGLDDGGVRLVSSGKILTDNAATLASGGVKDGSSLFCVKEIAKKTPALLAQTPQQTTTSVGSGGYAANATAQPPMLSGNADADAWFANRMAAATTQAANRMAANTTQALATPTADVDVAEKRTQYAAQLEELASMGFEDEHACIGALVKYAGDVEQAACMLGEEPDGALDQAAPSAAGPALSAFAYEDDEVVAHVYDISGGMAHSSSQMMIGKYMELLPHTGIVVFGKEYYFSKEAAVCEPGKSLPSPVKKTIRLGRTTKTPEELSAFLETLKAEFTTSSYNFLTRNSNHYADAACKFLLDGTGVPTELVSLLEDMNATPQGRQLATMMESMENNMRASGQGSMFSPTGSIFHGGTPANPAMAPMMMGGANEPRVRFQAQLAQLASMGFVDEVLNLRALQQANGNVDQAINTIIIASGQ